MCRKARGTSSWWSRRCRRRRWTARSIPKGPTASGNTIWLDANAAGYGWFIDPTPADDTEFTTPGNQGEMNRMDLLTVLEHELGHILGYNHTASGLMDDTLKTGVPELLLDQYFGRIG